jgi:hypothetical protein
MGEFVRFGADLIRMGDFAMFADDRPAAIAVVVAGSV